MTTKQIVVVILGALIFIVVFVVAVSLMVIAGDEDE